MRKLVVWVVLALVMTVSFSNETSASETKSKKIKVEEQTNKIVCLKSIRLSNASSHEEVWTMNVDGSSPKMIFKPSSYITRVAWDRDNKKIYCLEPDWRGGPGGRWLIKTGQKPEFTRGWSLNVPPQLTTSSDGLYYAIHSDATKEAPQECVRIYRKNKVILTIKNAWMVSFTHGSRTGDDRKILWDFAKNFAGEKIIQRDLEVKGGWAYVAYRHVNYLPADTYVLALYKAGGHWNLGLHSWAGHGPCYVGMPDDGVPEWISDLFK